MTSNATPPQRWIDEELWDMAMKRKPKRNADGSLNERDTLRIVYEVFKEETARHLAARMIDQAVLDGRLIWTVWIQENAENRLCIEGPGPDREQRYVRIDRATEEHLRAHVRLLHKKLKRRCSVGLWNSKIQNIAFFEGLLKVAEPAFREGAHTLQEAIMLATATTNSAIQ